MRKIQLILLAVIISIPSINAFAGDDDEGGKKGIRAGWQMSNFYNDGSSSADNLSSFYVAVFGEKKLMPILRLGSGVEYNSVGYSSDIAGNTSSFVRHSIAVPLYLKVKLGPVFALGGAAASFGVSDKYKLNDNSADIPDEIKTNTFDAPVFLGLGVKFLMISVEARYHWGTMDITKSNLSSPTQQYFQLGAGISF